MQKLQDITFTGKTDTGLKRDHNEDNYVSTELWGSSILLCCIDGVGGMAGGDVCSAAVAEKIEQYLKQMQPGDNPGGVLKQVLVRVNDDIISMQKDKPEYNEMACVLTAILVDTESNKVYMAHVGDTRLYEFADGQLTKLSHDHSPIGLREDMGILSEYEAMAHPKRNIIERCIGDMPLDDDTDYIETAEFPFKPGATYLLCSDGLTDLVTAAGISQILTGDTDVDDKADKLIAAANNAGGKDNITVLLLDNPDKRTEEEKLADTLVNNETIGKSQARLVPDNEPVSSDTSSQLSDEPAEKEEQAEELPTEEIKEPEMPEKEEDVLHKEDKDTSDKGHKKGTKKRQGKIHFLAGIILVMTGVIVWMGWEIHVIKQNQIKIMNDTLLLRSSNDSIINKNPNDSLDIDSTKFVLNRDSLNQILQDSLKTDSPVAGNE